MFYKHIFWFCSSLLDLYLFVGLTNSHLLVMNSTKRPTESNLDL